MTFARAPWRFDPLLDAIVDANGEPVVGPDNHRLMAVAPEMIEALFQYESDLIRPPTNDSVSRRLNMVRTLLSKARGESN